MKLIVSIAVKHTIDFENVGVCIGARELITSSVEAKDKSLADVTWSMLKGVGSFTLKMHDCRGRRAFNL
jgi:hypothetical protein